MFLKNALKKKRKRKKNEEVVFHQRSLTYSVIPSAYIRIYHFNIVSKRHDNR